jgi:cobalt import ATP-binding protein cbiO 1
MEEAVAADRIVLMNAGRIVTDGTPQEIFSDPQRVRALGLDVPLAAELAEHLRNRGMNLPQGILRDEELIRCLSE